MDEKQKDLNVVNWADFEKKEGTGDYLKFADKESHVIGIRKISQETAVFERKQKDGTMKPQACPQIHLHLDYVDAPLAAPRIFPTGAKYLIATIHEYHKTGMLYGWLFKIERSGMDLKTKYSMIPVQQRSGKPTKAEEVAAFV